MNLIRDVQALKSDTGTSRAPNVVADSWQRMVRWIMVRQSPVTTVLITSIIAIGGALRCAGVGAGRPFVYHPDEGIIVRSAMDMVATKDWNPHNFLYPSFLIDIEAGIVWIGHRIAGWPLATRPLGLFATESLPGQFDAYLAARIVVASFGLATILVTFVIGRRVGGRLAGLIAAAIVALAPVHIESSQFATTDVPVTFLCVCVLLFSILAVDEPGRRRWWVVASACVGLAASTKWNGLAVGIVPATLYLASRPRPFRVSTLVRSATPWLMLTAGIVALVAATPAVLIAPGEVAGWLATQAAAYSSAAYAELRGPHELNGIITEIQSAVDGFGPAVAVITVLAIWGLVAARRRVQFAMALFVIVYIAILSIPVLHYPRNALPILPYVAIGMGLLPRQVARTIRRRAATADIFGTGGSTARVRFLVAALLVVLMVPVMTRDVADARRLRRSDTRSVAYAWVVAHVPRNAIVAREQYTPQVPASMFRLRNHDGLYQRSMSWYRDQHVEYLITSSAMYDRFVGNTERPFDDAFYEALFRLPEVFHIEQGPDRPGPTIRIFRLSPNADAASSSPRSRQWGPSGGPTVSYRVQPTT